LPKPVRRLDRVVGAPVDRGRDRAAQLGSVLTLDDALLLQAVNQVGEAPHLVLHRCELISAALRAPSAALK
jgi:hypothetical protein